MEQRAVAILDAVLDGDDVVAAALAQRGLDDRVSALMLVELGFAPAIREAGVLFERGDFFLPELVCAAQAMKAAMAVLEPVLAARGTASRRGVVVLGTVQGDIHDIGKTLVGTVMSAYGYKVHDLGIDVPVARFVEVAKAHDADVIGASALLTTTMAVQASLVQAVRDAGLRARVMIGGAPTTPRWATEIGADAHADSAVQAVAVLEGWRDE